MLTPEHPRRVPDGQVRPQPELRRKDEPKLSVDRSLSAPTLSSLIDYLLPGVPAPFAVVIANGRPFLPPCAFVCDPNLRFGHLRAVAEYSLNTPSQRAAIPMKKRAPTIPTDSVESRVLTLRGQKVILDADLAAIYGVTTKRLNEQVKRNHKRFPPDFLFRWSREEAETANRSRSQNATLKRGQNLKFLLTALGVRLPADRPLYFDMARKLNFNPDFPHQFLQSFLVN